MTPPPPDQPDRRDPRMLAAGLVIALLLAGTARYWNPPLNRALEWLGLLHHKFP